MPRVEEYWNRNMEQGSCCMAFQKTPRSILKTFIRESNAIEGIRRAPTPSETDAHIAFVTLRHVTVADLEGFVSTIRPGAILRRKHGLNVRIGESVPLTPGGPDIEKRLQQILDTANEGKELIAADVNSWRQAYLVHQRYEHLYPFTDGNGRSGRALWLWMMGGVDIGGVAAVAETGFLHSWYYQSLQNWRER